MPGPTAAVMESPYKVVVCISFPVIITRMSTAGQQLHQWANVFVIFEPPKSSASQYTQPKWLFDVSLERVACRLNLILQGEKELHLFRFSSYLFSWRDLENSVNRTPTHGGNLNAGTRAQIQALEPIDHIPSQPSSSRTLFIPASGSSRSHHHDSANPSRKQQQSDYEIAFFLQNFDITDSDRQLALGIASRLPTMFKCCLKNYVVSQIRDRRFPIVCPTCKKDRSANSGSEFSDEIMLFLMIDFLLLI